MNLLQCEKEYDVVLADPPWRYDFSRSKSRRVENQYPTMTEMQISALPVRKVAAKNSTLFLWVPAPKLVLGIMVLENWGFLYKTNIVWDKQVIGMGYYARGQHEHLLIGTRGKPRVPLPASRRPSVLKERRGKHSRKPQVAYELIEAGWPLARKLELFARELRPGWDSWGDEIEGGFVGSDRPTAHCDLPAGEPADAHGSSDAGGDR